MEQVQTLENIIRSNAAAILSVSFSRAHKNCHAALSLIPFELPEGCLRVKVRSAPARKQSAPENGPFFSLEAFTQTQAFHRTVSASDLAQFAAVCAGAYFKTASVRYETPNGICTVTAQANRRGELRLFSHTEQPQPAASAPDRFCGIPEGTAVPFLVRLGVMTDRGTVIAAQRHKFRQINRFLSYVYDILPALQTDGGEPLSIIDFGCGKSYLTFAVYYCLTELLHIPVRVTGIDIKTDVVEHCAHIASLSQYEELFFQSESIESFRARAGKTSKERTDLVISLHACDTATDYALAFAAEHRAKAILAVPCCQHELNAALPNAQKSGALSADFSLFARYGLIRERFAALATDTLRAALLEAQGYRVQLLEFTDMSDTPKNILIRAVVKGPADPRAREAARSLETALGCNLTLSRLLSETTAR